MLSTLLALSGSAAGGFDVREAGGSDEAKAVVRTYGVKINVEDMDKALSFYCDKLGFEAEDRSNYPAQVFLKTGERIKLILNRVGKVQKPNPEDTRASFTLQVNDLDQAIARMKSLGVEFAEAEKRKEGVGYAISIRDPFGRSVSMMHQTIRKMDPFKEPRIYNFGYAIPDMETARDFYCNRLGFAIWSEKYLPLDLPLAHQDKTFAFMLHYRPGIKPIRSEYPRAMGFNTIVYETGNLAAVAPELKKSGVKILTERVQKSAQGSYIVFEDPFGNVSELLEPASKREAN